MVDEGNVYLEDVQATSSVKEAKTAAVTTAAAKTSGKRQRTLGDMLFFSDSQSKVRTAKKVKVSESAASISTSSQVSAPELGSTSGDTPPFSVTSFRESLSEEQKELLALECEVMGESWLAKLQDEIKQPYFISLKRFLSQEGVRGANDTPASCKVYPPPRHIYAWSNTPLGQVKVVIIGQDPYHGAGQAHGLCFSVPAGVPIPPSLRNIYAEIKAEYPEFVPPKHGNLTTWADNGVLMLNTCLTVRANQAGSHSQKGWETFTDKVVDVVDKYGGRTLGSTSGASPSTLGRGIVFLAWGAWAAKRVAKLNKTKHLILKSAHPSPFSANKGFLGNGHFKAANDWLQLKYGPDGRVDWCNLPGQ